MACMKDLGGRPEPNGADIIYGPRHCLDTCGMTSTTRCSYIGVLWPLVGGIESKISGFHRGQFVVLGSKQRAPVLDEPPPTISANP